MQEEHASLPIAHVVAFAVTSVGFWLDVQISKAVLPLSRSVIWLNLDKPEKRARPLAGGNSVPDLSSNLNFRSLDLLEECLELRLFSGKCTAVRVPRCCTALRARPLLKSL